MSTDTYASPFFDPLASSDAALTMKKAAVPPIDLQLRQSRHRDENKQRRDAALLEVRKDLERLSRGRSFT